MNRVPSAPNATPGAPTGATTPTGAGPPLPPGQQHQTPATTPVATPTPTSLPVSSSSQPNTSKNGYPRQHGQQPQPAAVVVSTANATPYMMNLPVAGTHPTATAGGAPGAAAGLVGVPHGQQPTSVSAAPQQQPPMMSMAVTSMAQSPAAGVAPYPFTAQANTSTAMQHATAGPNYNGAQTIIYVS